MMEAPWQEKARRKRSEIYSQIPDHWRLSDDTVQASWSAPDAIEASLTRKELHVTGLPASHLLECLRTGDLTATEVLSAFCHRAVLAHQLTCCLSELNFHAASLRALELDAHWREHKSPVGPLHGLPVSVMDRFHLSGLDSACGFASWVGSRRNRNDEGTLVGNLRELGAVVFCKTNIPMSMMAGETANNIVGTTTHPLNRNLSAGGACGGEGALIALKGSPFGIGTDVAGSSRIPSAFNGIWALKCSERRLALNGLATVLRGLPISRGAIGLLCSDHHGLTEVFQALLSAKPWLSDFETLELPWRQEKADAIHRRSYLPNNRPGRLVFGIMNTDGHVQPHPSICRALALVTDALQLCDYEVIAWEPPAHAPAVENLFKIFGSTSAIEARDAIRQSGEPPVPQLQDWYDHGDVEPSTSAEFWELCDQQDRYRAEYAEYWRSLGSKTQFGRTPDGIILPATPHTAVRHRDFHYFGYSAIANVLDYPAVTFPVTLGDRYFDGLPTRPTEFLSDVDELVQKTFNLENVHGMPVGLQIMCPRLQEEQTLALASAISKAMNEIQDPSRI